jgi:hypothetical protein
MSSFGNRMIGAAFSLYPSWWRERYLAEVRTVTEDLVAEGRSPVALSTNLALGALRARTQATGIPQTYDAWARRSCGVVVLATAPALAMLVSLWALDDASSTGVGMPRTVPTTGPANAIFLVGLLGSLLLAAVTIGGYLALCRGILDSEMGRSRWLRLLARAPKYLALLGFVLGAISPYYKPKEGMSAGRQFTFGGHAAVAQTLSYTAGVCLCLCALSAIVLLAEVVRHGTLPLRTLNVGLRVGYATAGLLWIMTVSVAALSAHFGLGAASIGRGTISGLPSGDPLAVFAVILGVCALSATVGAVMAERSMRVARALAA